MSKDTPPIVSASIERAIRDGLFYRDQDGNLRATAKAALALPGLQKRQREEPKQ
jgi:hypothetical protein